MQSQLANLLDCLDLEQVGADLFRGRNETERRLYIFGGQVVGQALVAAGRTASGRAAHSLHAYFLQRGDPAAPILYRVDRLRDGRSFGMRHVVALQGQREIFRMIASFHDTEKGYAHQTAMPAAPDPEDVPDLEERIRRSTVPVEGDPEHAIPRALDLRFTTLPLSLGGESGREPSMWWLRAPSRLPDDATLHRCILAYASDLWFNDAASRVHGREGALGPTRSASIDHSVWFHADARVDEWLLFKVESPRSIAARGLSQGVIFNRAGEHVASVVQESLIRPLGPGTVRALGRPE